MSTYRLMQDLLASLSEIMEKTERYFVAALFASTLSILFYYSSGPLTWDELWYLDLSVFPQELPALFFRYFHIYFQRLFILLTDDAILGARLYGSFCIAITACTVYYIMRMLRPNSGPFAALAAFVLFMSQTMILRYAGVTWADTTLMMLLSILSAIFIKAITCPEKFRNMCFLAGATTYFAIRTKEAGIVSGVLILGFMYHAYYLQGSLKDVLGVVAKVLFGIVCAHLVIMTFDAIWLGNPLFSMGVTNVTKALSIDWGYLTGDKTNAYKTANWFERIVREDMIITLVIYVMGMAALLPNEKKVALRFFWLLPLGMLLFLTLTSGVRRWIYESRYLVVFLPFFTLFSIYYIDILLGNNSWRRRLNTTYASAACSLLAVFCIIVGLNHYTEGMFSDGARRIVNSIIIPTMVIIAMGSLFFEKSKPHLSAGIIMFAVITGSIYPLMLSARFLKSGLNSQRSIERFYPISVFKDRVDLAKARSIFISKNIFDIGGMLGRSPASSSWMFEVFLMQKFTRDQFILGNEGAGDQLYDLVFLHNPQKSIEDYFTMHKYTLLRAEDKKVILAVRNESYLLK